MHPTAILNFGFRETREPSPCLQNLVRIKNKSNKFSEGGVPSTPAYENTTLTDSVTDNQPTVNIKSTQKDKNYSSDDSLSYKKISPIEDAEKFAKRLLRRNRSRYDAKELAGQLKEMSKAIADGDYMGAVRIAEKAARQSGDRPLIVLTFFALFDILFKVDTSVLDRDFPLPTLFVSTIFLSLIFIISYKTVEPSSFKQTITSAEYPLLSPFRQIKAI